MQNRVRALVLGALLPCVLLPAQDGLDAVVRRIDGSEIQGSVAIADGTVSVTPADAAPASFPLADVLAVEPRAPAAAPTAKAPITVWLRSGSSFPAVAATGTPATEQSPATVTFTLLSGGELTVQLRYIAAMRTRDVEPRTFAADRKDPDKNLDYLYVVKDKAPQRFSVAIGSIHDGAVHFDLRGKAFDFPLLGEDSTAAIVFGKNTGFAPDRQAKPRAAIATTAGERLEGKLLRLGSDLRLLLDEGTEVAVPSRFVQRIDVLSDKLTFLGAMQPKVEQTPAFDRLPEWTVDGSPVGPGILLGGVQHARGIVMMPRTRLVYDLGGRYDVFEATVGIDDRGGPQAHAILRVFVDGKLAFESEAMTRGKQPQKLQIELGKAAALAIEADFGLNYDLGDLCAFADARVVQR